jgi:GntR family transcriptional regulator
MRKQASFRLLAQSLRSDLQSGKFSIGTALPTEAELQAKVGLSRHTVRRALQEIVAEGLIYRVPGRGTFPLGTPTNGAYMRSYGSVADLMSISADTEMELVTPLETIINVEAAQRLLLTSDRVAMLRYRRIHEGLPFSYTTVYLSPELARETALATHLPELGGRKRITVIEILDTVLKGQLHSAHQSIGATACPPEIASYIDCASGEPVLRIDRTFFDQQARPLELATAYYNASRYTYRALLQRAPTH